MAQVISATVLDKAGKEVDMDSGKPGAISRLSVIVSDGSASMELVFFKGIKKLRGYSPPKLKIVQFLLSSAIRRKSQRQRAENRRICCGFGNID